ncbi:MAG: DNA polymerase [Acidimicrobiales bacterium]
MPVRVIRQAGQLEQLHQALEDAAALAIDTETHVGTGALRVVSLATRSATGVEQAWVVDVRDVAAPLLAPLLVGHTADGWNAAFDAGVLDGAVFEPAGVAPSQRLCWWDAMLADALLHQGRSGFGFYHGLAWAAQRYLGVEAEGKGTTQLSFDLTSELTEEQIAYAASDAVETLWVADRLRQELIDAGLCEVAALEMAARPFLDRLTRTGFPFDGPGYRQFLNQQADALRDCITELAVLTGGGQANLFSPDLEPAWNPASEPQAKQALNRHSPDQVETYFKHTEGNVRRLEATDPLTASVLAEIGGPIAETLLRYRHHAKLVSTYGESLLGHVGADGRIRPQYLQVVGTSTGRLASRFPNAQNLAPETKPFVRPAAGRVLVHADLSQAELRWMAQVSGDPVLQAALHGGGDVHVATASAMFAQDVAALAENNPERYGELRARAKAINFGILYGLGARSLARTLSRPDHSVTPADATALLDTYLGTYQGVAGWLRGHDRVVEELAANPPAVDWERSFDLLEGFERLRNFKRDFRALHGRAPGLSEQLEHSELGDRDRLEWLAGFENAVVLDRSGLPVGWETRTLAGRRRLFDVTMWAVLRSAALRAAQRSDAAWAALRDHYAADTGLRLSDGGAALPERDLQKVFDDRTIRLGLVQRVGQVMGVAERDRLLERALRARIAILGNAHRNAPIQGGVADAMLAAFARLWAWLADDPEVWPVQTVHDSVVLECPIDRRHEVRQRLTEALTEAMAHYTPDVAVRADVDARSSLSGSDVLHA